MKPAPFNYHDPRTIDDAVDLIGRLENARPLAGGQSLVPMMNFRYAMPDHIVDLNGVAELAGIACGETISIGAMTRQRDLEFSDDLARACPVLKEALLHVGHRQTRNRGTLGGSLCHLDPAAEQPAVMLLHDAVLTARSHDGAREIAMRDFALGFMMTSLEPTDILTRVQFAPWPPDHGYAFEEYARRHGDFAIAAAGALVSLDDNGRIGRLAIVLAGVGPTALRLDDIEAALVGETLSDETIKAAAAAARGCEAVEDAHVTAQYRQHLAGVIVTRALRRAFACAQERSLVHA